LQNYKLPAIAPKKYSTIFDIGPRIGISYSAVPKLAESLGIEAEIFRSRKNRSVRPHYSEQDISRMQQLVIDMRTLKDTDEPIGQIAEDYGLFTSAIMNFMNNAEPRIIPTSKFLPTSGQRAYVLDMYDAARVRYHFETTLVTEDNGRKTKAMLCESLGTNESYVKNVADALGLQLKMGRYKSVEKDRFIPVKFWDASEARQIEDAIKNRGDITINALINKIRRGEYHVAKGRSDVSVALGPLAVVGETVPIHSADSSVISPSLIEQSDSAEVTISQSPLEENASIEYIDTEEARASVFSSIETFEALLIAAKAQENEVLRTKEGELLGVSPQALARVRAYCRENKYRLIPQGWHLLDNFAANLKMTQSEVLELIRDSLENYRHSMVRICSPQISGNRRAHVVAISDVVYRSQWKRRPGR
jgi:hypothetical protein